MRNKIKDTVVKNAPEILESQNLKVSTKIITTEVNKDSSVRLDKENALVENSKEYLRIKPKSPEMFPKNKPKEYIPETKDIAEEEIDEYLVDRIDHLKYVVDENRLPKNLSSVMDEHEKLIKSLNNSGINRSKNPSDYVEQSKKSIKYLFDPRVKFNTEMRGHLANQLAAISRNYARQDFPENLSCSAVELADSVPIKKRPDLVTYHPSLNHENENSFQHGIELLHARQIADLTGRPIIVTGDRSFNDSDIVALAKKRRIIIPHKSKQTNPDFLEEFESETGEKVLVPGDSKTRSANSLTSSEAYAKQNHNNEYWSIGSLSEENKKKLIGIFAKKAIQEQAKKVASVQLDKNIKDLTEFSQEHDIKKLNSIVEVVRPTFNSEFDPEEK